MTIMIPAWVNGDLTPVEKLEAHKRGLRHKAVSVFVTRRSEILLQQRAADKYHTPQLWANTCCTHPNWDEDAVDCAVRRLNEELGISDLAPQFREQLEYRADVGNGMIEHELVDVFLAEAPDDLEVTANPAEVMDTRWVDYPTLLSDVDRHPERFTPWLKIYLRDHAGSILGPDMALKRRA